jgi:hypothetical protein
MHYPEHVGADLTPAEVLANLERLCGPMPEEFVKEFWQRVAEYAAQRAQWAAAAI